MGLPSIEPIAPVHIFGRMDPERYLTSYGWKRGKTRWSHPDQHGWFSTEEALRAQLDLRQRQLAFELGFGGDVDRLLRALESLQKKFPQPVPTGGYPTRYEAVHAYVEANPKAKASAIGRALNLPTKVVYKLLARRKVRLAKQRLQPLSADVLSPQVVAVATVKRTTPAKVARLTGVPLHAARAAKEITLAKRPSRAEVENRRAKHVLPMLLGPGDRRENCTGYETCVDRAARVVRGDETVHCPDDCAEFEPVDRKRMLHQIAMTQPL